MRGFDGKSEAWNNQSKCCMVPKENGIIQGYFVSMSENEMKVLDKYEICPEVYKRELIPVIGHFSNQD